MAMCKGCELYHSPKWTGTLEWIHCRLPLCEAAASNCLACSGFHQEYVASNSLVATLGSGREGGRKGGKSGKGSQERELNISKSTEPITAFLPHLEWKPYMLLWSDLQNTQHQIKCLDHFFAIVSLTKQRHDRENIVGCEQVFLYHCQH